MVSIFFASMCLNAAAQGASGQMSLRVQVFPGNVANIYPFLGVNKGFYKDAGVDVQLVQIGSAPQANAALISKSVDMILTSPDNALVLKSRGFKPVAVVGVTKYPNFVLTARDPASFPNLNKGYPALMDDFSGKTVGVYAPASASERIVKFLLQGAKKPLDAVKFIPVGGPGQAMAGLAAKQLDIASDVFSVGLAAELSGLGKIILDCSLAPCPNSIKSPGAMGLAYFTTESFLKEHEEAVKAFAKAHQRIDAWMHDPANKAELRKEIESSVATPAKVSPDKYFGGLTDWAIRFFGLTFGVEAFEASQQGMLSTGDLKEPVALDGLIWSGMPKG